MTYVVILLAQIVDRTTEGVAISPRPSQAGAGLHTQPEAPGSAPAPTSLPHREAPSGPRAPAPGRAVEKEGDVRCSGIFQSRVWEGNSP